MNGPHELEKNIYYAVFERGSLQLDLIGDGTVHLNYILTDLLSAEPEITERLVLNSPTVKTFLVSHIFMLWF